MAPTLFKLSEIDEKLNCYSVNVSSTLPTKLNTPNNFLHSVLAAIRATLKRVPRYVSLRANGTRRRVTSDAFSKQPSTFTSSHLHNT